MTDINRLLAAEFPIERQRIYLNHAAVAPWPQRAADAVTRFARESVEWGAQNYGRWLDLEHTLRGQCARLLNAPSGDDIAFTKNTSEALSFVAQGFPWRPGDNVVIPAEEFPSNRIPWEALAELGVETRQVPLHARSDPERALIAACDARTRLMSVSSVQYASGLRLDLGLLGILCKERGIAFCVDAIQGLGVIPHDVQAMHIDFLMADGHKWLCGPEGIGIFYCREAWRGQLKLHEHGWHMTQDYLDFDRRDWRPAASARRFECGSPNMLGMHALAASLALIEEVGVAEIERRVLARAEYLFDFVTGHPDLELITSNAAGRYAGIVTFRHKKIAAPEVVQHLQKNQVICAHRGGGIRFSPHCYTTLKNLAKAVEYFERLIFISAS